MEELDPGRGWLVDGARFLKTKKGLDFSENSLNAILKSLGRAGRDSPFFPNLLFLKETTALDLGPTYPLINHGVQLTCTDRPLLYWN